MAANDAGAQPDFNIITTSLNTAAAQLGHCANLLANAGTQEILQGLGRIETKMAGIEARIVASDRNGVARLQNSFLIATGDARLEALCSVLTGNPIPNFPARVADIEYMSATRAGIILREIGAPTHGGIHAKRARIRAFCGLRPAF
ncbi:hypothetical protein B0T24DRAFT_643565 [Lasiosphaeria ovina]|uniref:Uncharacterized protein n=1 Tax=Lasiosphaeria ovina TaxID=92902 RepID=A0AAE0MXL4_9PEZI|nr:hypothetical protein B0T24DRAFT_643565 [Lasiosphaeria ovina]